MINEENSVEEQGLGPIAINQFGEKFFFNLNRYGFDKVSAQALFETQFSDALFNEHALHIVVGTDSGLLPQYVQSKSLPNGARYIFIEPERVLQALHANQMLVDLDERIACISIQDWNEAIRDFKITDYFYIDAVRSFNAICAQDDFIDEYAELSWHITEVLSQLQWQNNVELGAESFIARQINNVADNRLPAKLLENAFCGKTVVLLAGGPSLDDALPWVKQHRTRVVVFAVSRIARQLLQAQIEPDFIFSVDPTELSFDISKEMLGFSRKTTFICSYHVVPTLLNQWIERVFYLGARVPWDSSLNAENLTGAGPTVTNTALSVAHAFGFKKIVLAGVDLCFTPEGFTHAKGSNEYLAGPKFDLTSLQVETNGGNLVPTSCDFNQAIMTLSMQAKMFTSDGCQIINVSVGAAKIESIEFIPLSDLQVDKDLVDVSVVLNAVKHSEQDQKQYYRKVTEELKRAQFQVKAIARLAKNGRRLNDEMYNTNGVIVDRKDKKKLDKTEKKLNREHRHFSKLVKRFGIRSFLKMIKPFADEEWTADEAKELGNAYYDAYIDGSKRLLALLDNAVERVNARQQELSQTPDFELMIAQCRKDKSYGRVRLWREIFSMASISEEVKQEFDELDRLYVAVLNEQNTRHFNRAKSHGDLVVARHRAELLFKHKKIAELQDLLNALDKHQQPDLAEPYKDLVNAYLAELQTQLDTALDYYQKIIDRGDVLIEQALSRVAGIGIETEDVATAGLALQCLSQINPVYLSLYAEMLRLNGDMVGAIDAYNSYISQFPQDTVVQMKLVRLYVEGKVYDGAEMMLDYILQQKPNFQAAVSMKEQIAANRLM